MQQTLKYTPHASEQQEGAYSTSLSCGNQQYTLIINNIQNTCGDSEILP